MRRLDALTYRKRRDILHNPITAPRAELHTQLFAHPNHNPFYGVPAQPAAVPPPPAPPPPPPAPPPPPPPPTSGVKRPFPPGPGASVQPSRSGAGSSAQHAAAPPVISGSASYKAPPSRHNQRHNPYSRPANPSRGGAASSAQAAAPPPARPQWLPPGYNYIQAQVAGGRDLVTLRNIRQDRLQNRQFRPVMPNPGQERRPRDNDEPSQRRRAS